MDLELSHEPVLLELIVRLVLNLAVLGTVVWGIYFPSARRKEYVFTYVLISITVFFMCFFLAAVKLELGFALGLFAIFGIIRYRTSTIPIREMTYLFLIIAVAVINGVAHKSYFFPELVIANAIFILMSWAMERLWMNKGEQRKTIVYEKIELLRPDRRSDLIEDLKKRTGLDIHKVEIGHVDFLKDISDITIYFTARVNNINLPDFEILHRHVDTDDD
ncbi:MAG: DUF4956 domain-containing protein [Marinilabiliaceae bacterium]|nr:DUF4956 domain-containing protein [Marinilabiliaceae bacterium]